MAFSARPSSSNELNQLVNETGHGFAVGDVLRFNGTIFVKAQANSLVNCQGVVIVSLVSSVDSFYVTQIGWVNDLTATFVAGTQYYVDPAVAGALTSVQPTSTGQIYLPCFVADDDHSGYFYTSSGIAISSPTEFNWTVVTTNTTLATNNGYFANSAGNINFTLPATFNVGDVIQIAGVSTGSWAVLQNAGQSILVGALGATTIGVGGSLASTNAHDSIELIGYVANTTLYLKPTEGSITVV